MATVTSDQHERLCACGKTFVMRPHERTRAPNPITTYEVVNGNVAINPDGSYRIVPKSENYDGPRHVSHFTDCPLADRFGRRSRS